VGLSDTRVVVEPLIRSLIGDSFSSIFSEGGAESPSAGFIPVVVIEAALVIVVSRFGPHDPGAMLLGLPVTPSSRDLCKTFRHEVDNNGRSYE